MGKELIVIVTSRVPERCDCVWSMSVGQWGGDASPSFTLVQVKESCWVHRHLRGNYPVEARTESDLDN